MNESLNYEGNYSEAIARTCPVAQRYVLFGSVDFVQLTCPRGIIVEKMLEYMAFRAHYETVGPKEDIPVNEMMERLTPEVVLEL